MKLGRQQTPWSGTLN